MACAHVYYKLKVPTATCTGLVLPTFYLQATVQKDIELSNSLTVTFHLLWV